MFVVMSRNFSMCFSNSQESLLDIPHIICVLLSGYVMYIIAFNWTEFNYSLDSDVLCLLVKVDFVYIDFSKCFYKNIVCDGRFEQAQYITLHVVP